MEDVTCIHPYIFRCNAGRLLWESPTGWLSQAGVGLAQGGNYSSTEGRDMHGDRFHGGIDKMGHSTSWDQRDAF